MPLQNDLYLQDRFEATQFWQKSPTVLAWVEQSFSMHPSLQWVKQWPLGYDYWDIHDIHEERQRDVEMLLSYVFLNGWKLEMVVRDCLGVLHTLCPSWRWWRRENEREREREIHKKYVSVELLIHVDPLTISSWSWFFMTTHFQKYLRLGSTKDRRLQVDGSTSASNRFMHEDGTGLVCHVANLRFEVFPFIMEHPKLTWCSLW